DPVDGQGQIKWKTGDQIRIYNGNGENAVFTLKSGANTTDGTFTYAGEFDMVPPYLALYPSTAMMNDADDVIFEVPAVQNLTEPGTFANGANPMLASGTDDNLYFQNLCGGLGIRLYGDAHVSSITILGYPSEKLNGQFAVFDEGLETSHCDGDNLVTLTCDVTLSPTDTTDFYAVLPVGVLHYGVIVEIYDGETMIGQIPLPEGNAAQVERNTIKSFRPVKLTTVPEGAINGLFTINANGDQVYFSKGNLQYTQSTQTWSFMEHQYDMVETEGQDVGENYSNQDIISLFGFGTSGYAHGARCWEPWRTKLSNNWYYVYGQWYYNLYDQTGQADWGYNAISNGGNQEGMWRTLTKSEWEYVIDGRTGIRTAHATVNGICGAILLPDDWDASTYNLNNTNPPAGGASFNDNTITASEWANSFEANGAVFLPAAGSRYETSLDQVNSIGEYWAASSHESEYNSSFAYIIHFDLYNAIYSTYTWRSVGTSVRLVRDVE
ncbi:MAG: hypothetical protein IKX35_05795, partial [Bacteroidales bacterium]|nr:hypothetical protein [Bacteroidales bacterium]